jgi:hypothetical protein
VTSREINLHMNDERCETCKNLFCVLEGYSIAKCSLLDDRDNLVEMHYSCDFWEKKRKEKQK